MGVKIMTKFLNFEKLKTNNKQILSNNIEK